MRTRRWLMSACCIAVVSVTPACSTASKSSGARAVTLGPQQAVTTTTADDSSRSLRVESGPGPVPPPCPTDLTVPSMATGGFCGPLPSAGNGRGDDGECTGQETTAPCCPTLVLGRYYSYTMPGSCDGLTIFDGRRWVSELPPSSPVADFDVWIALTTSDTAVWISPKGSVGLQPYAGQPLFTCSG
jgi:hypothetical protein